ncbi:MAG: radical SAM protein [Endomicrobiales bacterium]|nr:radical SAM protein [Endomicrobiales bacterium]
MENKDFNYIYGPVPSWRLGSSLGIDPLSNEDKICSFDCIYCQIGKTVVFTLERKIYVWTEEIIKEIKSLPSVPIDYITFSGRGEPTLAKNLWYMIKAVKSLDIAKTAVITNSSLLHKEEVRKDLLAADFVVAKLDADSQETLSQINKPVKEITFDLILDGLKKFRAEYTGKLALQIMFIKENKDKAENIAKIAREMNPDEVQINTPLRPCKVKPLPREEVEEISGYFKGMNVISVYEAKKKEVKPISAEKTLIRRGKV